jgi:hypothetical protein
MIVTRDNPPNFTFESSETRVVSPLTISSSERLSRMYTTTFLFTRSQLKKKLKLNCSRQPSQLY